MKKLYYSCLAGKDGELNVIRKATTKEMAESVKYSTITTLNGMESITDLHFHYIGSLTQEQSKLFKSAGNLKTVDSLKKALNEIKNGRIK